MKWERLGIALFLASAPIVAMFAGCADVLGIMSDRYVKTTDSDSGAGASQTLDDGSPWGCLSLPGKQADPNAQVTVSVYGYDPTQPFSLAGTIDGGSDLYFATYAGIPGIAVRSCGQELDPSCVKSGSPVVDTNDAGRADFVVPENFSGFFQLNPPVYIPETLYTGPLLPGDPTASYFVPFLTYETVSALSGFLNITVRLTPDSGVGQLNIGVFDCNDHTAPGVAFTISNYVSDTTVYYNVGGVPTVTANATDNGVGGGGAINVPAGEEQITATLLAGSVPLGNVPVTVIGGAMTTVFIRVKPSHAP